jgi:outer membrane protein
MQKFIMYLLTWFLVVPEIHAQESFTLSEAISYGIKQSNEVKLKNLAITDATHQVREYKSIGIPKVSANVNYQYYLAVPSQPVQDFLGPTVYGILFDENVIPERDLGAPQTFKFTLFQPNSLLAGVEASSLLFDASYLYGVKAAKNYKNLVLEEKEVSIQSIKENVTRAYMAVLLAGENLKVMENNKNNVEKSLKEVKAMFENGFAESLDVDRLQLSYDNLQTQTEYIGQLVEISKNLLKFQMNYPMDKNIELTQTIDNIMIEWNNQPELSKDNIDFTKRKEYTLLQLGQDLNNLDYKRIKAGYYPTLRGFANVQGNLYRKNLFDNAETGWIPQSAVGLSLNVPIYDGGERSAKLQRNKIKNMQTEIQRQTLENSIRLQVQNAFISYNNANKILENRKKALDMTNSIYSKTLVKFREGVGSSFEVTQAEGALYQAQASYTESVYNVINALLDWKTALGLL